MTCGARLAPVKKASEIKYSRSGAFSGSQAASTKH